MNKLFKIIMVLGVISVTANTFGSEMGIKMSNLKMGYAPAAIKQDGGGGGIEKGTMQLDVSFNLGSHGAIVGNRYYGSGVGVGFIPGVTINFDYAVHPYASVGGYFGFGGRRGVASIGVGARGVFHIYQLISDKANTKVSPDDLDFYFPFHVGALIGVVKNSGNYNKGTYAGASIGGGLGVRYYFTDNVGIMTEVGWLEMAVCKIGAAFRF